MISRHYILITLVRHGKPHKVAAELGSAADFSAWLEVEGDRGIDRAPRFHGALPSACRVYCSDLRRAVDSASCLAAPAKVNVDPMFREVGLGAPAAPAFIRLPIGAWTTLARLAWFLRLVDGPESSDRARSRARDAAARLDADARMYGHVVVVGHALFNVLMAAELRRLGWSGPRRPSHRFWAQTTYKNEVPQPPGEAACGPPATSQVPVAMHPSRSCGSTSSNRTPRTSQAPDRASYPRTELRGFTAPSGKRRHRAPGTFWRILWRRSRRGHGAASFRSRSTSPLA